MSYVETLGLKAVAYTQCLVRMTDKHIVLESKFYVIISRMSSFVAMNFTSLKPRFNNVDGRSVKVDYAIFTDDVDHMRSST